MKNSKNNKEMRIIAQTKVSNSKMVRVLVWTKEKGEFYDWVRWDRIYQLIYKGYRGYFVVALAD